MTAAQRYVAAKNLDAQPTDAQRRFIASLGGDMRAVQHMTRGAASAYIGTLKGATPTTGAPAMTTPPPPDKPQYTPPAAPIVQAPRIDPFAVTLSPQMIRSMIVKGRYAWQPDSNTPLVFVKVDDWQTGRKKGQFDIKTQHGPSYHPALTIYPSGNMKVFARNLDPILMGIIADRDGTALTYARRKNVCLNCGTELTVERSRFYGIGPECETRRASIIESVHVELGGTYEELRATNNLPDWLQSADFEE